MPPDVTPESPEALLSHLVQARLDHDLALELERSLAGWKASLKAAGETAVRLGPVLQGLDYLTSDDSATPSVAAVAADHALITGAPRTAAFLSLLHYLLLEAEPFNLSLLATLEPLAERREPLLPVVARLAVLAAAAHMPERGNARGLDDRLVSAARGRVQELTFADRAGVYLSHLPDLAYDLRLVSYHTGSYSFSLQSFYGPITVLDFPDHSDPVVLPLDGTRFSPAGYRAPPAGASPADWTARVHRQDSTVQANAVVDADGLCRRQAQRLDLDGVSTILQPGDEALEVHVERGADLSADAWQTALSEALEHYRRHFPDRRPRAVFMVSWLLDPVVRSLLPEAARVRRFQARFRLYPARYDAAYARECVLGGGTGRLTSLQQALLALERAGGRLREGGGFILLP